MRTILLFGFGLMFGIWLLTGAHFSRRIGEVESRAAAVNARYVHAQELLSTARSQILLASVYVRDALLDPESSRDGSYRQRIEETSAAADQALRQYVPILDARAEGARVAGLRHDIADFHDTMLQVLEAGAAREPPDAQRLLRTRVMPRREVVIRMSEEIQALNRSAFVRQQDELAAIHQAMQRDLWMTLSVALLACVAIGLTATVYAGRLQTRLQRQRARDVQNARELQQLSAKLIAAQEEERRTIARELHDEVGQVLTAVKVELAVAQRQIDGRGGPPHLLDDSRLVIEGALSTVRDLSHLLHPALLDDLGLPATVDWYLRSFGVRHGLRVEVLHDGMEERLAPEVESSAYRIVQEALTNVAKHARATNCRVYLQRLPATVLITVEDDGVGFDAAATHRTGERRGLGLIGIRERVSELRGTLRLESAPGKGTRLTVELPARARAAAADARQLVVDV
ncbi:MAG TPA: ATP-binding protein [Vicinamibacterales bacterium]|nr:ATP-binding protein [Vicinamibacterales bacterium]